MWRKRVKHLLAASKEEFCFRHLFVRPLFIADSPERVNERFSSRFQHFGCLERVPPVAERRIRTRFDIVRVVR